MKQFIGIMTFILLFTTACFSIMKKDMNSENFSQLRKKMVEVQLRREGIKNKRVLEAMGETPREKFVPEAYRSRAYEDGPLPIGYEQTISQPFIVAYMLEALDLQASDKVLEVGTGSGYNTAVMSPLVKEVYSIEIVEALGKRSKTLLRELNYKNVNVKIGDGYKGWTEKAFFDVIILTAAPARIPKPLIEQLAEGGRLLAPVGGYNQELVLLKKLKGKIQKTKLLPVRFVPMTGKAQDK